MLNFNDYLLNEDMHINVLKSNSKIIDSLVEKARKAKIIEIKTEKHGIFHKELKVIKDQDPNYYFSINHINFHDNQKIVDEYHGDRFVLKSNGQLFDISFVVNDTHKKDYKYTYQLSDFSLIIMSKSPFKAEEISKIFNEQITGDDRDKIINFDCEISEDSSNKEYKDTMSIEKYEKYDNVEIPVAFYYIIYKYKLKIKDAVKLTQEYIKKNSIQYKELIDNYSVELTSTQKSIESMNSFVFSIPRKFYIKPPGNEYSKENSNSSSNSKYLGISFGAYESGYIRELAEGKGQMLKKFNPTSIAGWDEAFKLIMHYLRNLQKNIEKRGGKLFLTPEDRAKHRGTITGHDYGI